MLRLVAYAHDGVRKFPISSHELMIGSQEGCDICLPYTGVAHRHARLWQDGDQLAIQDLGSRKGVLVNGARVREAHLEVLDEIRVGAITLLLEEVLPDHRANTDLRADRRETPQRPCITPERMTEHLAAISHWVLADTESRTTLESLTSSVLSDFGGGVLFLLYGGAENPGVKFVVATEPDWMAGGESLLAQIEPHREREGGLETGDLVGALEGEKAWIFYRFLTGIDRSYLLMAAFPRFLPGQWSPAPSLSTLGDLLILGLVHHVGRYEPILPGQRSQNDLTLAPGLILGESKAMSRVVEQIRAVADPGIHVLLRGEPGSGREPFARTLHLSGPRRHGPFAVVSCDGAESYQIEADLFGAEVPGKEEPVRRDGKLVLSDGGTLYLENIEKLPLELQAKLVRFLRSGEVARPGSAEVEKSDVRIIAGSRTALEPYVARDLFRVDLAYRLSQFAIDIPPLRERREDLPLLIQWHVNRFCHETGKRVQGIAVKAMSALLAYDFPGNLPELENIARQMVYLCPVGQPMDLNLLPEEVRSSKVRAAARVSSTSDLELERLVTSCEQAAIREALRRTDGNKSQAAALLGLSRNGLAMKMERYGLKS